MADDFCYESLSLSEAVPLQPVVRTLSTTRADPCDTDCVEVCEQVFDYVEVLPTIEFGTLIQWNLHPNFRDPGPYTYHLQIGGTANQEATDWTTVGFDATDVFYMIDDEKRVFGKTQWTHYRIAMNTAEATYYSQPVSATGSLGRQDRNIFRNMVKAQQKQLQAGEGTRGFLLKRRHCGAPCTSCIDPLTKDVTGDCDVCYGTGFVGGYFAPMPCVWAGLERKGSRNHRHVAARGTIDDRLRTVARMTGIPQLFSGDIWVEENSDHRYVMHEIDEAVLWRGKVVAYDVGVRLLPFTDPAYRFEIPEGIATPG